MRVPSDFQIPVTAPRSGVLEALGLKIGESVTAQVVGQNANGSTLVQIGKQQVSLNLPQQYPPGTELQFDVKGSGAKLELALISASAKPVSAPAATNSGTAPQPQVIVSDSILNQNPQPRPGAPSTAQSAAPTSTPAASPPLSGATATQTTPQANSAYPSPPLTSPTPATVTPASLTPGASATPSGGTTPVAPQQTPIPLPPLAATSLNLVAGQTITARVTAPNAQGQPQLVINGQSVPVTAPSLPPAGTVVQGSVVAHNGQLALSVQPSKPGPSPYPTLPQTNPTGQSTSSAAPTQSHTSAHSTSVAQAAVPPNLAQPLPVPNLSQVAAQAVFKQDSVGKLITTITGLNASISRDLPPNVAQLVRQVANAPLKPENQPITASELKDAVARSGVFLESTLARGALPPSGPQGDMKNMLMLLRNALGNWLEGDALPQTRGQKPAPPMRGAPPRPDGQTSQNPLADGTTAREAGRHMLAQTESALSRMRLFQLSSLPEAGQRGNPAAAQDLHFELPLMLGGQAAMAQFQISRDGGNESDPAQRGWQMVFAVHFGVIGAVGAKVSFRARKTGVVVWAENETTAAVLEEMLPELVEGLEAQGLELSSVRVSHRMPQSSNANAGGFVDSLS